MLKDHHELDQDSRGKSVGLVKWNFVQLRLHDY